ncbi:hypothetical protein [Chitinophaga sp. 22620]|uniref:hypothetical protein n=1 Tax=Chitinophaga sp. 22620 TaxID=3453952 RepID=UPI003F87DD1A
MFKLKLDLVFLSAVLAVGLVLTTKANVLGRKATTDCFKMDIDVINSAGTVTNTLIQNEIRSSILADIWASPYLNEDIFAETIDQTMVCPGTARFCCAKFNILDPTTPGVPIKIVNGISGKWSVQVFFDN